MVIHFDCAEYVNGSIVLAQTDRYSAKETVAVLRGNLPELREALRVLDTEQGKSPAGDVS